MNKDEAVGLVGDRVLLREVGCQSVMEGVVDEISPSGLYLHFNGAWLHMHLWDLVEKLPPKQSRLYAKDALA